MSETTTKRDRTGNVLVHLDLTDRRRLDSVRDRLEADLGVPVSLSTTIRTLIRRADADEEPRP